LEMSMALFVELVVAEPVAVEAMAVLQILED
jgi:hypothetical protein